QDRRVAGARQSPEGHARPDGVKYLARLKRLRHGRDTWLRHEIVAALLAGTDGSVLDVGGLSDRLAGPLAGVDVTTVNVEGPADVIFDGERLPWADSSFEVVTSIDVLEHLRPATRPRHLAELLRVARRRVVACCPLAPGDAAPTERELADRFAEVSGKREEFLEEHAANGLPAEAELRTLISRFPAEWE